MTDRILFLDIDGVICTDRAYFASGQDKTKTVLRTWDTIGIKLISRLCVDYDLKVVISSTWRHRYDVPLILLTHGFVGEFHKDEKTDGKFSSNRGQEIRMWLDDHPEVTQYIIIDDDDSGIACTSLEPFHVKTDSFDGILTHHWHQAKKICEKFLQTP